MGTGALILVNEPRRLLVSHFVLTDGAFVCGRSAQCDFVIPHPTISRLHAEFRVCGTHVEVVDLKSRNGTFVDETRVEIAVLPLCTPLRLGAISFVLNEHAEEDGCSSLCGTASTRELPSLPNPDSPASPLSAAESRVLDLVLDGLAEKQIATRLHISRHTAHNHVRNIYRTLGVHSRAELLALLVRKNRNVPGGVTRIHFELPEPEDPCS